MRLLAWTVSLSLATVLLCGCASMKPSLPAWLGGEKEEKVAGAGGEKPESLKGLLALARLSERRGQKEQAEKVYREVMQEWPDDPAPHHRLAVMRAAEGKFEAAATHFSRAMELAPSDAELLSDFGYFCYLQDNAGAAETYLRRAVELEPTNAAYCNNLAIVLGEQGRYEEARALFGRAGSEADAQANMAFVYARRGEIQRALESYSKALDEDEQLRPAAEGLAQLAKYAPPARRTLTDPTVLADGRTTRPMHGSGSAEHRGRAGAASGEQQAAYFSPTPRPEGRVQSANWNPGVPAGPVDFASTTMPGPAATGSQLPYRAGPMGQPGTALAGAVPQGPSAVSPPVGAPRPDWPQSPGAFAQGAPQHEVCVSDQTAPTAAAASPLPTSYHNYQRPTSSDAAGNGFPVQP